MGAVKGQDHDEFIPGLKEQAIGNLVATNQRGLGVQFARHTVAAGPVLALTFGTLTDPGGNALSAMEGAEYFVIVEDETTGVIYAYDQAVAKTATGFTVEAGPVQGDVLNIVVVGQIADQPAPA